SWFAMPFNDRSVNSRMCASPAGSWASAARFCPRDLVILLLFLRVLAVRRDAGVLQDEDHAGNRFGTRVLLVVRLRVARLRVHVGLFLFLLGLIGDRRHLDRRTGV